MPNKTNNVAVDVLYVFPDEGISFEVLDYFTQLEDFKFFIEAKNDFINDFRSDCIGVCEQCEFKDSNLPCSDDDYEVIFFKDSKPTTCSYEVAEMFAKFTGKNYEKLRVAT